MHASLAIVTVIIVAYNVNKRLLVVAHAVLECIFHKRDENQRRDPHLGAIIGVFDGELKFVAKTNAVEPYIVLHELTLF